MKQCKIIILFLIFLLIQGCKDSLGIDPSVQISPADPDDYIGDSSPYMFKIDTILFKDIMETYNISSVDYPQLWNEYKFTLNAHIDTTQPKLKIWIEFLLSSPNLYGSESDSRRTDWITKVKIRFKTVVVENREYSLSGNQDSWKLMSVSIDSKDGSTIESNNYFGNAITSKITFTDIDETNGIILGKISIDLSPVSSLQTKSLESTFTIQYK